MTEEEKKALERQIETTVRSRRTRAHRHRVVDNRIVFDPAAQPAFTTAGEKLTPVAHHDILVFPPEDVLPEGHFFRFPVTKVPRPGVVAGRYEDLPEVMDTYDYAERAVHAVASTEKWSSQRSDERGAAFATLPVKPEPAATSGGICYLINTRNLNFRNAWTAEEWNDAPEGVDLEPAPGVDATQFEALLAGPRGQVFHVVLSGLDQWQPGDSATARLDGRELAVCQIECVELRYQSEVWQQLRNGCVAGRVTYDDDTGARVIPLVNITALTPVARTNERRVSTAVKSGETS